MTAIKNAPQDRRVPVPHRPAIQKTRRRGGTGVWVLGVMLLLAAAALFNWRDSFSDALYGLVTTSGQPIDAFQTHRVTEGTLYITVTEDGHVESAQNIDLKCKIEGGSIILWIEEEGKIVSAGDVLVRLDAAAIEEKIKQQKILYEKANATYIQSEEAYAVASISVVEYEEGLFIQQLQLADATITIARQNLKSAENMLAHSENMFRKGYLNKLQLDADEFAVERNQLELEAAQTARKVLVEHTREKTLKELKSNRDAAKAAMEADKAASELEKSTLDRLMDQLENAVIIAPQAGMVIYANDTGRRRSEGPVVEEGAAVRESQTIVKLPDLSEMQVKVTVHETKVDKIEVGMQANVAIRGITTHGMVTSIANQPEPGSWYSSSVKEYATVVKLSDSSDIPGLKPGMTAAVEILIEELKDVKYVPLLGVVEEPGGYFCYVQSPMQPGGYEKRPVVIGATSDAYIEIKDGLNEGDEVILNPRSTIKEAREAAAMHSEAKTKDSTKLEQKEDSAKPQAKAKKDVPKQTTESNTTKQGAAQPSGEAIAGPAPTGQESPVIEAKTKTKDEKVTPQNAAEADG